MSFISESAFTKESRIYADYNGTTPLDEKVVAAITESLVQDWANPNSDYELGCLAKRKIEVANCQLTALVNGDGGKVIFTSGGTEANNMVILGLAGSASAKPRHVVTTNVEHPAIVLPLQHAEKTTGLEVSQVNVEPFDSIVDRIISAIKKETVLVSIMAANNETGVLMPLQAIGKQIADINERRKIQGIPPVIFHSDAAQIIGKESFDVKHLNLDCATIVGHKFYGPRIGALWTRVDIPPLLFGGGSADRPGTPNTPMIVGLGIAASLVVKNLNQYRSSMEIAKKHLEENLKKLPVKVSINCKNLPRLPNTVNVSLGDNLTGKEILGRCKCILASVSAACHSNQSQASQILINSGVAPDAARTSIRLSIGRNATIQMMDEIVQDLYQALENS